MTIQKLTRPRTLRVSRSNLRQKQRATLDQAKKNTVVLISAPNPDEQKVLVDRKYFDDLVGKIRSLVETLEIMSDEKLFSQIMQAAPTVTEDARLGKLHSLEEVFGKD